VSKNTGCWLASSEAAGLYEVSVLALQKLFGGLAILVTIPAVTLDP
jgi:hypothetical protein